MRVGVTGHQNLPGQAIEAIAQDVRGQLTNDSELIGVTGLAAGADQLFASIVLSLRGQLEVVIPSEDYEKTFSNPELVNQYRTLLRSANQVYRMPFVEASEEAFFEAGKEVVNRSDRLVAIWDGEPAQGLGGTADIVAYAKRRGIPVTVIWPKGLVRGQATTGS
jgi:hypothetical protein